MDLYVKKSAISGTIVAPPSKSHSTRAVLFACMSNGSCVVHNYLNSPDVKNMLEAFNLCGIRSHLHDSKIHITGCGGVLSNPSDVIDAGNSGQVLRFFSGIASTIGNGYTVITGDQSIRQNRYMEPIISAINQLGGFCVSSRNNGYAPIIIKGEIKPGIVKMNGEDSQHVSAMLIATAFLDGKSEIFVDNPGEKPWIDMTLYWLNKIGVNVINDNYQHYINHGMASYEGYEITIPGDFSSIAFPLVASIISRTNLIIKNLDENDAQGDKKIIQVLNDIGAKIEFKDNDLYAYGKNINQLRGIEIDVNDFIDALPILAVLACFSEGKTRLYNAKVARTKESDRISTIVNELKKMGANIYEENDEIIIYQSRLRGEMLDTHNDHRIAMSLCVAGMNASGITRLIDCKSISKSYPMFVNDLTEIGANIEIYN